MGRTLSKLGFATMLFIISMVIGTVGYKSVEGYTTLDALYMSIITFSTVGFGEIGALSDSGKLFTILYITLNLGILAYTVSVLSSILFEGELRKVLRKYIITREVRKLKDHIIICGFGSNGEKAAEELKQEGKPFIIIEQEANALEVAAQKKYNIIPGNATADETLLEAGLERASTVISTLSSDADNVFITLTAKQIKPDVKVIARASEPSSEKKLLRAGASHVVMPDRLGGMHMANLVTKPNVVQFLEMMNGVGEASLDMQEVAQGALKPEFQNKTLGELDIRNKTGATIIAFKDEHKGFIFNAKSRAQVNKGDVLIVLGTKETLRDFNESFLAKSQA
ncbi:potassium channel protein [Fulvivirga sp. RKSG066]|uniref:potassium channel family protein n=1 Tax=Fulvivirga aurantia TaxID=2529383 RepID=UPI0012BD4CAE|nr:potassium channel protein [Fulvivirga aurantia]MTI23123.1 potassium channel protein [Fulvivirga aurantia]